MAQLQHNGGSRGGQQYWPQKRARAAHESSNSANPRLKAQLSAVLRDQLLSKLKGMKSAEDAAMWARRILPAKNALNSTDARQIEEAFHARLAIVEGASHTQPQITNSRSGRELWERNQDQGADRR
jgi:hypothetical protein